MATPSKLKPGAMVRRKGDRSVPDEWVLVPREATPEMLAAGAREVDWYDHNAADCYSAMLSAAPTRPAVASGEPTAEQLKVLDEVIRLLESPHVMPTPAGGINYSPEHYFGLLHDFKRVRTELARSAAAKGEG